MRFCMHLSWSAAPLNYHWFHRNRTAQCKHLRRAPIHRFRHWNWINVYWQIDSSSFKWNYTRYKHNTIRCETMWYDSSRFHLSLHKKTPSKSRLLFMYIQAHWECNQAYKQILNLIKVETRINNNSSRLK